jgi:hypothetical protein
MEEKSGFMYPNESEYYAKVLSQIEGRPISMLDIKHDGRGVWAVSNAPEPGKEYTIFNMPRKTSGIIPREMPYKEGSYKTWEDLEKETNTNPNLNPAQPSPKEVPPKYPIGLLGVNHFKMDKVDKDLERFQKSGVKTLAVELPKDLQTEVEAYLKSPRTKEDKEALGKAWINASITPEGIKQAQKTFEEISGEGISKEEMKAQMLESADNPMTSNTTIKYLIDTTAKAHDLGLKVVCVDSPLKDNSSSLEHIEKKMEARNSHMANQISELARDSKTAAIVGGAHLESTNGSKPIQNFLDEKSAKYNIFDYDKGDPEITQINKFFGEKPKKNKELIEYMEMQ